jgi:hypothetical protein
VQQQMNDLTHWQQGEQRGNVVPSLARLLLSLVKPSEPTAE